MAEERPDETPELMRAGDTTGIILPMVSRARFGPKPGHSFFPTELPDGAVTLSVHDLDHDRVMEIGRDVCRDYHETLKALAK